VPSNDLYRLADQVAAKYGIPKALFRALIKQESGWNPRAGSPAGAQGLTQLMPATARGLGVRNVFDPAQNLDGGARYLRDQYKRFGRWDLALSAYNSGPGGAEGSGKVEGFRETQNYVKNILAALGQAPGPLRPGAPAPAAPSARGGAAPGVGFSPAKRTGLSEATRNLIFGDDPEFAAQLGRIASSRTTPPVRPARGGRGNTKQPRSATPALDQVRAEFGPQAMLAIIRQAQKLGLRVSENPFVDPVDPVHTKNSWHYKTFPGKYEGKPLGRGADISGSPEAMAEIFNWIKRRYPGIEEAIYDPIGSIFDGTFKPGAYGGHDKHVHVGL
jgi:hypothetical protein